MQNLLCRRVPAGDGVELATDVYLPDGSGGPFPTVVVRTPYHRVGLQATAPAFTERGYAVVAQDCRGKYDSDGEFEPLVDEARDGQATLDWVANQSWCSGRIGLWGRSYLGIVQVPAASGGHEALRCIVPSVAPGSFFRDWLRYDGCFALANAVRWSLTHATCKNQPPQVHIDWKALNKLSGTQAIAEHVGFETPALATWAGHDRYDSYWEAVDQSRMYPSIRVPGLHGGGWFDHLTRTQYRAYSGIRDGGATAAGREGQRLLIGPWGHKTMGTRGVEHCRYGEWEFGHAADFPVLEEELRFLDLHLKEIDSGLSSQPPVRVFLMGENRWLGLDDWPPPEATGQDWHLTSQGRANTGGGDGCLTRELPGRQGADRYTSDPADPVPSRGGPLYWGLEHVGPVSQVDLMGREDVLYYRSGALSDPLVVVGEVELELWITSNREDTDIVAKLCVEEADGRITCLTLGSLRCRYRDGWSEPRPLEPGTPTSLSVQLGQTAYTFAAGSRIGLVIAGSDFPRILPNLNRMSAPWEVVESMVADNQVLHGPQQLSRLRLPVVEW